MSNFYDSFIGYKSSEASPSFPSPLSLRLWRVINYPASGQSSQQIIHDNYNFIHKSHKQRCTNACAMSEDPEIAIRAFVAIKSIDKKVPLSLRLWRVMDKPASGHSSQTIALTFKLMADERRMAFRIKAQKLSFVHSWQL